MEEVADAQRRDARPVAGRDLRDRALAQDRAVGDGGVALDEDPVGLAVGDEPVGGVADVREELVDLRDDAAVL